MGMFEDTVAKNRRWWEEEDSRTKGVKDKKNLDKEFSVFSLGTRLLNAAYLHQAQGKKQEVVFKVISGALGKSRTNAIMEYIARDAAYMQNTPSLTLEDQDGNQVKDATGRAATIEDWAATFTDPALYKKQAWKLEELYKLEAERDRLEYDGEQRQLEQTERQRLQELNRQIKGQYTIKDGKRQNLRVTVPADVKHMVFSVGGKDHSLVKAEAAMRAYLAENFAEKGFKYVWVAHNDTNNLHFHVVMQGRSQVLDKPLTFDKGDLFVLRREFAHHLDRVGIARQATMRRDRLKTIEDMQQSRQALEDRLDVYQAKVKRGKSVFDALGQRQQMLKATEALIAQGKRRSLFDSFSPQAKAGLEAEMKGLNQLKAGLVKASSAKEIEATVAAFAAEHQELLHKVRKSPAPGEDRRKEQRLLAYQTQMLGLQAKQIEQAMKVLLKEKSPEAKEALKTLQALHRSAQRQKTK